MTEKRYTLFLQSRCGYVCGDRETYAFGELPPLTRSPGFRA
jgi:hypothetical protein